MDSPEDKAPANPARGEGAPAPDLDSRTRRALRLFMEDPAGLPAFRSVEELLKSAQAWDTLASVYDQRFGAIANPAERAALLTRKGHLLESYLSRGEEAVQCYRQALDAHPADLDAHRRLAWTFERAKRWPDLAARLEKAAEHLKSRDDRVAALLLLAEIRVAHLDRADEAVDCFEQALALDPDRNDVFDGLCTLLMEMSRNEALAAALQTRAEYEEDGRALLRRAAVLYAGPLADTPGILDRAIACQERLVALEDAHGEGTANHSYLADLYRRAERWEPLVALLEADAARGGDAAEPLRDAAEILDSRIGDPARALTIWRTLLERGNDDGEALTACERLARASDDSETLAEILGIRNRAGHFENDAVAISANEERAHILLAMGGHDEEAARALEAVLSRDPGREEALAQLCELYDRLDRPVDRARKMARLADALPAATPPGKRGEAWREAAQALEAVGESEQATGAYEKAGDLLPEDIFVLTRLQALYDARGETDRACAAAKAELALLCDGKPEQPGQDPEREGILLDRLARAAAEEGRAEQALAHWQALLERAPAHREALRALAELFEKNGDSEGLLSVLTQLSQIEEAPGPRVALHLRVGRIYETACEEPEEAVTCYEKALAVDPHHEAALEALTGLLPSLGRWEAQATLLSRRASIAEGEARGALELERARILRDHLSDEEGAMRAFENALAVAPGCVEAMRDLADLHRAAGRWADVEALLARELEVEGDAERRIEIAEARAELWEGPLADPEKAAAIWEDLLETAPDHGVARERLMAWHRSAGRWADVARILETEISQGPSSDRERALHAELAQLCEEKLAATDRALAHYRAAACLDPGDSAMQAGLHRCLARSEAWVEVAGLLWFEAEAKREARPHAWADALVEIARIHEEALDDCAGAERILRDVLIAVPDHESAQSRLFGRLEARGDLEGLASLIATSLRTCENAAREVTLAREALRVAVAREAAGTGDADETVRACRRIITLGAEDDDVLRILALRLEEAGRHKQLLDALSMRLAVAENREVRLDVSLRLAALWEEHFHRPDRALAIYRQARQIDATCLPALRAMVRLCEEEGRSEELLGVCEALAKEEPDPMARAAILYRLATIYHAHFERDHDAIGNLERCLGLDPSHEDARDMLEHLTRKHQRYRTLARILEDRIALATAGNSAIGLSEFEEELGDVLTDHLGEPKEAALAYSRAFEGAENDASRRRVGLKREAVLTQLDAADALREFYPVLLETMGEPEAVSRRAEAAGVWARYG
ncbi:MAG: hypothetical protein ACE5FC_05500, partial [Myxococcota bacterium]